MLLVLSVAEQEQKSWVEEENLLLHILYNKK